jgi:hypothetical protein
MRGSAGCCRHVQLPAHPATSRSPFRSSCDDLGVDKGVVTSSPCSPTGRRAAARTGDIERGPWTDFPSLCRDKCLFYKHFGEHGEGAGGHMR